MLRQIGRNKGTEYNKPFSGSARRRKSFVHSFGGASQLGMPRGMEDKRHPLVCTYLTYALHEQRHLSSGIMAVGTRGSRYRLSHW